MNRPTSFQVISSFSGWLIGDFILTPPFSDRFLKHPAVSSVPGFIPNRQDLHNIQLLDIVPMVTILTGPVEPAGISGIVHAGFIMRTLGIFLVGRPVVVLYFGWVHFATFQYLPTSPPGLNPFCTRSKFGGLRVSFINPFNRRKVQLAVAFSAGRVLCGC